MFKNFCPLTVFSGSCRCDWLLPLRLIIQPIGDHCIAQYRHVVQSARITADNVHIRSMLIDTLSPHISFIRIFALFELAKCLFAVFFFIYNWRYEHLNSWSLRQKWNENDRMSNWSPKVVKAKREKAEKKRLTFGLLLTMLRRR